MRIGFYAGHDFSTPSAKAFHIIEILKKLEDVRLVFYKQQDYLDEFEEILERQDVEYIEIEGSGISFNKGMLRTVNFFKREDVEVVFIKNYILNALPIMVKKKLDIPLVLEVHGDLRHEMNVQGRKLRFFGPVIENVQKKNMDVADRISFISQKVRERHPEVPDSKSVVIENAADKEFIEKYSHLEKFDEPTVTYLGNLTETKGVTKIPDIAEEMPEKRFRIIGGGHLKEEIEQKKKEKELDNLELTGWMDREEALAEMAKSHISLMPYPENFDNYFSPFKLFESMAVGTPSVSTPSGEPARIIRETQCGSISEDFNADSIVETLEELFENPEKRREYRDNGIKEVQEYYNWERFANEVKKLIQEVS